MAALLSEQHRGQPQRLPSMVLARFHSQSAPASLAAPHTLQLCRVWGARLPGKTVVPLLSKRQRLTATLTTSNLGACKAAGNPRVSGPRTRPPPSHAVTRFRDAARSPCTGSLHKRPACRRHKVSPVLSYISSGSRMRRAAPGMGP